MRVVDAPAVDFHRLRRVDALLRAIRGGRPRSTRPSSEPTRSESAPPLYRLRIIYLGCCHAAAVSVLLGGGHSSR